MKSHEALNTKKIVITGGPATGKTTIINYLKHKGYTCFEEVARKLTSDALELENIKEIHSNPIELVADSDKFNQTLIDLRLADFLKSLTLMDEICFFDRGTPDVLAYMTCFNQPIKESIIDLCKTYIYDCVFLLPPWELIFTQDEERFETFNQATKIHTQLKKTYQSFGYHVIEVPIGTVEKRTEFILKSL
ncbi:ATP-binding protein [Flavobacteriaceae bacterium]|jgi:predicted ATPase|nr:ATP-binding protein [Flavobacteriaceae bacterium]